MDSQQQQQSQQQLIPYDESLQQFKRQILGWIEVDDMINKLKNAIQDKLKVRARLEQNIKQFMSTYHIEDVNAKDITLRYRVVKKKVQTSRAEMKQRAVDKFGSDRADEIMNVLFQQQESVEKPTLRRVNVKKRLVID